MTTIDALDTIILQELLREGRRSFTSIAKDVGLTKEAVTKRAQDLKSSGVIVGATIQFNFQKFQYSAVAMILLSVDPVQVPQVINRMKEIPDVGGFRYYNSIYNIAAISRLKNLRDLELVKETISRKSSIHDIRTYLWLDVRNTPENIFPRSVVTNMPHEVGNIDNNRGQGSVKLDKLDMQIAEKLTANGRVSFKEIAEETKSSIDTIARRYKNLRKNNFLKVSIQINPLELGFQSILDFRIALVAQKETNQVVDQLSRICGVSYIVKIAGDYDLLLAALVKDTKDIIRINEEVAEVPNVKRIEGTLRQLRPVWPGQRQYLSTF